MSLCWVPYLYCYSEYLYAEGCIFSELLWMSFVLSVALLLLCCISWCCVSLCCVSWHTGIFLSQFTLIFIFCIHLANLNQETFTRNFYFPFVLFYAFCAPVVKCMVMRTKVEAPVKWKNSRPNQDLSLLIDSLFIILICFTKNTQVSSSTNGHFQPTPFPFLSNVLSLTPLIHCSLSLSLSLSLSAYSPLCFHLLRFHLNTPMIL